MMHLVIIDLGYLVAYKSGFCFCGPLLLKSISSYRGFFKRAEMRQIHQNVRICFL